MRELRERQGFRTVDVASFLGIAESTVRNWEKGRTIPTLTPDQYQLLLQKYNITVDQLVASVAKSRAAAQ